MLVSDFYRGIFDLCHYQEERLCLAPRRNFLKRDSSGHLRIMPTTLDEPIRFTRAPGVWFVFVQ